MPTRLKRPRIKLNPHAFWDRLNVLNMTQNQLASRAEITSGYVSLLVSGKRSPSPELRGRLMEILGVADFHDLFIVEECDES